MAVAKHQGDDDRDAEPGPEDRAHTEGLARRPRRQGGGHFRMTRDRHLRVVAAPGEHDLAHGERHNQGVQPDNADEDPVREPHEHSRSKASRYREPQAVVRSATDPGDQIASEGDHTGGREVDPAMHDYEHLPKRRDGKDGRVGEDVRPRCVAESRRRFDRGDDRERSGGQPNGKKARGEESIRRQSSSGRTRRRSDSGRRWRAVRVHSAILSR